MTKRQGARQDSLGMDIIDIILEDHKPLKELIEIMKDDEKPLSKRFAAFEKFAPTLLRHAKPEEKALYTRMKDDKELAEEGFEGDVEHGIADQLVEEIKRTEDKDLLGARIKVLAELVEHHIDEEESEMFPSIREETSSEDREKWGVEYLMFQEDLEAEGLNDAKPQDHQEEPHAQSDEDESSDVQEAPMQHHAR